MSAENHWILTAIKYTTDWSVIKVLSNVQAEIIAKVIHNNIIMQYSSFNELLSDNKSNLKSKVLTAYINLLSTKHRLITPYHSQINEKVKNLNEILKSMLTKMLIN